MQSSQDLLHVPDAAAPLLLHHLAAQPSDDAAETGTAVLFVHPAGQDGSVWTDTTEENCNTWFQNSVESGTDAWALDLRGFGGTEWGPDGAPEDPFECTRADQAVYDVDAAAEHILGTSTPAPALHVVGWGWGGLVAALFASETDLPIASLTILAPRLGEPTDDPAALVDWSRTGRSLGRNIAAQNGSADDDLGFTPPPGPMIDLQDVFGGQPVFDPAEITCPTLLVRAIDDPGSSESDTALLYLRLGAETRQLWEVPGDHFFVLGAEGAEMSLRVMHWQHSINAAAREARDSQVS